MNSMSEVQVIEHVMRNKYNYYRMLMVERNAAEKDIKTAYRKLALKCHPDKCTHTHAAEAFKLISTAYATLSDNTKRQIYDRQGAEGVQRHESNAGRRPTAQGTAAMRRAAQQDFFQEFFFGNGVFFGGQAEGRGMNGPFGPQPRRQYQRAGQGAATFEQVELNGSWLLLIPILIFLLLALLLQSSVLDISSPTSASDGGGGGLGKSMHDAFALTPDPARSLVIERVTSTHGLRVKYYTSRRWNELLSRRRDLLYTMEREVLTSQRQYLANRCEAETFKYRTRGLTEVPPICNEFSRFRKAFR